ncbi:hypothetical protein G6F31_021208 [Rhizopus arrhizus]|nr:hypothetical protein G6F31_021208 [Rhizopus arrhizus]
MGRDGLQCLPGGGVHRSLLGSQFGTKQLGLAGVQERHDLGSRFQPPGQAAQIGLVDGEVLGGQVGARQGGAGEGAMGGPGGGFVAAGQARNDGAGLAVQRRQARGTSVRCRTAVGRA